MKLKQCFLMAIISFSFIEVANAQSPDTLRRRDADGWEFIQVKRGNTLLSEGYKHNGLQEGTWTSYWDNGYPQNFLPPGYDVIL